MPYIGNPIYQSAFVTDQFSGNGSTTAFTMSVAPAGVSNVLVAVSGVLQDPSTYGVAGNTITFSTAPPSGTGNISCRYLGVPVTGIVTTAYRTVTEFTATASQTTFTPPSYTVGFINVYLNGVLLGSADYTATNGTTVVLATGASAGNLVTVESFRVETVLNALSNSAGSVSASNLAGGSVTDSKLSLTTPALGTPSALVLTNATGLPAAQLTGSKTIPKATLPTGSVLQVVQQSVNPNFSTSSSTFVHATAHEVSITTSVANSKILLFCNTPLQVSTSSTGIGQATFRSSVDSYSADRGIISVVAAPESGGGWIMPTILMYLDSPAQAANTTITYRVYVRKAQGSNAIYYADQWGYTASYSFILQEISA